MSRLGHVLHRTGTLLCVGTRRKKLRKQETPLSFRTFLLKSSGRERYPGKLSEEPLSRVGCVGERYGLRPGGAGQVCAIVRAKNCNFVLDVVPVVLVFSFVPCALLFGWYFESCVPVWVVPLLFPLRTVNVPYNLLRTAKARCSLPFQVVMLLSLRAANVSVFDISKK